MSRTPDSERARRGVSSSDKPPRGYGSRDRSAIEMRSVEPMGRRR